MKRPKFLFPKNMFSSTELANALACVWASHSPFWFCLRARVILPSKGMALERMLYFASKGVNMLGGAVAFDKGVERTDEVEVIKNEAVKSRMPRRTRAACLTAVAPLHRRVLW
ncbi:MAG: hypothetical protein P8077_05805 [Gammaproteobacteria bacterium]